MGPEGLGDVNKGDDAGLYQEDNEEQLTHPPSSSQHTPSSTILSPLGYLIHNKGKALLKIQVLNDCASQFLSTLAAGCQECLPDSETSTTMVANPLNVF